MGVHWRRVNDLPRIEHVLRIEGGLDFLHHVIALVADHERDEFTAQPPVPVLPAQRPPVFFDQMRDVGRDAAEGLEPLLGLEVEKRPRMQLPGPCMRVVDATDAVFFKEEGIEFRDVIRQVADIHCRVLHDLARLGVADHIAHQPLAGPAQLPDFRALLPSQHRNCVAVAGGFPARLQGGDDFFQRMPIVPPQFHHEDGPGVADHEIAVALLREVRLRALKDVAIDQLAGRRRVLDGDQIGPQGLVHRSKMSADQCRVRRRQRIAVQFELQAEKQSPLRTGNQAAEVEIPARSRIERRRIHEQVEGITRVPPRDGGPRKVVGDQAPITLLPQKIAHASVDAALHTGSLGTLGLELPHPQGAEDSLSPVTEKPADRNKVLPRAAVDDRIRPAGVVSHHASNHGAIGRRSLGTEKQPMLGQLKIQFVAHHARLHAHAAGTAVDFHDRIEVARKIDHEAVADDLASERGSRRARNDPDAVPAGEENDLPHIFLGFRKRNGRRQFLVFRRIGGIEPAHDRTGGQFAGKLQLFERRRLHRSVLHDQSLLLPGAQKFPQFGRVRTPSLPHEVARRGAAQHEAIFQCSAGEKSENVTGVEAIPRPGALAGPGTMRCPDDREVVAPGGHGKPVSVDDHMGKTQVRAQLTGQAQALVRLGGRLAESGQAREDVCLVAIESQSDGTVGLEISQGIQHRQDVVGATARGVDQIEEEMRTVGQLREDLLLQQTPDARHMRVECPIGQRDHPRLAAGCPVGAIVQAPPHVRRGEFLQLPHRAVHQLAVRKLEGQRAPRFTTPRMG